MDEQKQAEAQVVHTSMTQNNTQNVPQETQPVVSQELKDFGDMWKISTQYAKSDLVPDTYKNKPQNVIIALGMAQKTGFDVYTIMNNLNIVKGKASWSGSFCRTLIEATGLYKDLDLIEVGEKDKDTWGYYAQAIKKSDGKIVKGATVTMAMAKTEGWTKNPKWLSMPELMMQYRALAFFARVYASSAINGLQTLEEVEDVTSNNNIMEDIL
jgi:hypothetical protein